MRVLRIKKKQKSDYRHGDLKKQLVMAALQLIKERGDVEFTLRELAEKTGVTHAAAYKHFASKNEILLHIAGEGFGLLSSYFKKAMSHDPEDIVALGESYILFAVDNPEYFKVMFHPDLCLPEQALDTPSVGAETYLILKKCIRDNQSSGQFTQQPLERLSLASWSLVHGLAVLWVNGNLSPLPDGTRIKPRDVAKSVARVLVDGLRGRD